MNLNERFKAQLQNLGLAIPRVLFPADSVDLQTWSVIACDQYTSDQAYWDEVAKLCVGKPSTLHITLPEIYLKDPKIADRISGIQATMRDYLNQKILAPLGEGIMYLERRTESGLRQGIMLAFDLERYDFAPDSQTLIRATEGTIVDRIPPRLAIREKALVELPHIMILIDDPHFTVVEALGQSLAATQPRYTINLMKHGGQLSGRFVTDEAAVSQVLTALGRLKATTESEQKTANPLLFAMGDGNHSLATAKTSWQNIKRELAAADRSEAEIMAHPARFAFAELVNIHSPGLRFEPIHRAVFTANKAAFVDACRNHPALESLQPSTEAVVQKQLATTEPGQRSFGVFDGSQWFLGQVKADAALLPPALADQAFQNLQKTEPHADIDFIHGWTDTTKLTAENAVAVMVPVIGRDRLFGQVQRHGPLPRKAFSMGEAEEKRYYVEARQIVE